MDDIARYLPRVLRDALAKMPPDSSAGPVEVHPLEAAVLFVDVSGYTSLTQRAVSAGPDAVEHFNTRLNDFFVRIIGHVYREGGDVVGFAGDAVLAIFPCGCDVLDAVARRAARCALACRQEFLDLTGVGLDTAQPIVGTRITLACGPAWLASFGQPGRRRHLLAAGEAIRTVAMSQGSAVAGSVLLTAGFERMLGDAGLVVPTATGLHFLEALKEEQQDFPVRPAHGAAPPDSALLPYLPTALAAHVCAGQGAWLAEMRFVCPVFLFLGSRDTQRPLPIGEIADAVLCFEEELLSLGGEILHLRSDEHGTVAVGMFGTPGSTHEDDASRAVRSAQRIDARLAPRGIRVDIGVSSGAALCAVYGNAERCDYDVLGNVMNLAARLMQKHDGVLCDRATAGRAGFAAQARDLGAIRFKGLAEPVDVVRLAETGARTSDPARADHHAAQPDPVGRQQELQAIAGWLSSLGGRVDSAGSRSLLIEGEAGMGKSTLVRSLLRQAGDMGMECVLVHGSAIEHLTPYFVWRAVLLKLFAPPGDASQEGLARAVLSALASDTRLTRFSPLLNEILPLGIEPNETTLQMEPSARATTTAELLLHLIRSRGGPRILIFEDGHWIDSASWPVIAQAARVPTHGAIVLTVRSEAVMPPEARDHLATARLGGLQLQGLTTAATAALVARCLGADTAAADVAHFVRERSGGNPLFVEELALLLRERGQLSVEAGACIAREGLDRHARHELPMTVRGAILERVDRLSPQQQLVAKIASVIGADADVATLEELCVPLGRRAFQEELRRLEDRLLGSTAQTEGKATFRFRHAVIRETVYSMLTPSQRRALHLSAGEWYEKRAAGDTDPVASLLAHHFRCADARPRAIRYLTRAGEMALQAHANGEAVQFISGALELAPEEAGVDVGRARLRRLLAEAHLKLSNLPACRAQLLRGLHTLHQPLRGGRLGLAAGIAGTLAAVAWPGRRGSSAAEAREADFLAAQIHQLRAEVAYFEHDNLSLLHGTFACLRKARGAEPSRELATSHGTAAIVLGLLGLQSVAASHLRAAESTALRCGHAPTVAYVRHLACVCHSAVGAWDSAERAVEAAARGYRELGELYRWQSTRMILAYQALHRGDFARVALHLEEADAASVFPSGPQQVRIWFRTAQLAANNAAALLGTAPLPAPSLVKEVEQLAQLADSSQALLCHGFAADAQRLQGHWSEARVNAERGLEVLLAHRPTTYYSLLGIASICGTFLALAEHEPAQWRDVRPRASAALRALWVFARMVPIATPSVQLLRARMLLLDGRVATGERLLDQSIASAERVGTLGVAAAARRLREMAEVSWSDRATQTGWV